jgi:hypothetical protein
MSVTAIPYLRAIFHLGTRASGVLRDTSTRDACVPKFDRKLRIERTSINP